MHMCTKRHSAAKRSWLIRASWLIRWTGIPPINRITRINHVKLDHCADERIEVQQRLT